MIPNSSVAHLTLAVTDIKSSARFYELALGWQPIKRPQNTLFPTAWLSIASDLEIHFVEIEGFVPSSFEDEYGRHFAISYPASGYDTLKERLVKYGAELIPPARETPFERFFFKDPQGYIIEIVDADRMPESQTIK